MILDEADAMTQDAQNALRRGNYTGIALPKLNTAFYPMKLILEYSNRRFSSCVLPRALCFEVKSWEAKVLYMI